MKPALHVHEKPSAPPTSSEHVPPRPHRPERIASPVVQAQICHACSPRVCMSRRVRTVVSMRDYYNTMGGREKYTNTQHTLKSRHARRAQLCKQARKQYLCKVVLLMSLNLEKYHMPLRKIPENLGFPHECILHETVTLDNSHQDR